ncbi:MAG TPA: hypothetical protein VMU96_01370 [Casimicrobiaceae bacterium]|nr:hypothetical protein [Casimicrobiaceae bacterium]
MNALGHGTRIAQSLESLADLPRNRRRDRLAVGTLMLPVWHPRPYSKATGDDMRILLLIGVDASSLQKASGEFRSPVLGAH